MDINDNVERARRAALAVARSETLCQWFALCARRAAGVIAHPVLGYVPTCERCAALADERDEFTSIDALNCESCGDALDDERCVIGALFCADCDAFATGGVEQLVDEQLVDCDCDRGHDCLRDETALRFVAQYGAPGVGAAYNCTVCARPWARVSGAFFDVCELAHIASPEDMR